MSCRLLSGDTEVWRGQPGRRLKSVRRGRPRGIPGVGEEHANSDRGDRRDKPSATLLA